MTYTFTFQGQTFKVELEEDDKQIQIGIEDKTIDVEFAKIEENLYSIIYD